MQINGVPFHIERADEYTLSFMENFPEVFNGASIAAIAAKICVLTASSIVRDSLFEKPFQNSFYRSSTMVSFSFATM